MYVRSDIQNKAKKMQIEEKGKKNLNDFKKILVLKKILCIETKKIQ